MANVPQINTTGITSAEGLLGQLFQYLQGLNFTGSAPQVSATLPTYQNTGLSAMMGNLKNAPMAAMPGGGLDPGYGTSEYRSAINLGMNPARSAVDQARIAERMGIAGQNLGLSQQNFMNNMSMQQMIQSMLSGTAGQLGTIGDYPPNLRGQAQSTAASGTGGSGSGGLLGMFGL
jgi:hypothetical protein